MADRIGQRFGKYRLTRFLGKGTYGEVYLGEHVVDNSFAAVKLLLAELNQEQLTKFINEASTASNMKHPHIVRLLDFGIKDGTPYLTTTYAPNDTLRDCHKAGAHLELDTVVSYVKQIAEALQYMHDDARIHRDIKPENILIGEKDELLLADFGIAVEAHGTGYMGVEDANGTMAYAAPEQIKKDPRRASDQYSLAIMVYEWLCGERPFTGDQAQMMYQQIYVSPPSFSEHNVKIAQGIEAVVMKALDKDYKKRFPTVQEFAAALEEAYIESKRAKTPEALHELMQLRSQNDLDILQDETFISNLFDCIQENPDWWQRQANADVANLSRIAFDTSAPTQTTHILKDVLEKVVKATTRKLAWSVQMQRWQTFDLFFDVVVISSPIVLDSPYWQDALNLLSHRPIEVHENRSPFIMLIEIIGTSQPPIATANFWSALAELLRQRWDVMRQNQYMLLIQLMTALETNAPPMSNDLFWGTLFKLIADDPLVFVDSNWRVFDIIVKVLKKTLSQPNSNLPFWVVLQELLFLHKEDLKKDEGWQPLGDLIDVLSKVTVLDRFGIALLTLLEGEVTTIVTNNWSLYKNLLLLWGRLPTLEQNMTIQSTWLTIPLQPPEHLEEFLGLSVPRSWHDKVVKDIISSFSQLSTSMYPTMMQLVTKYSPRFEDVLLHLCANALGQQAALTFFAFLVQYKYVRSQDIFEQIFFSKHITAETADQLLAKVITQLRDDYIVKLVHTRGEEIVIRSGITPTLVVLFKRYFDTFGQSDLKGTLVKSGNLFKVLLHYPPAENDTPSWKPIYEYIESCDVIRMFFQAINIEFESLYQLRVALHTIFQYKNKVDKQKQREYVRDSLLADFASKIKTEDELGRVIDILGPELITEKETAFGWPSDLLLLHALVYRAANRYNRTRENDSEAYQILIPYIKACLYRAQHLKDLRLRDAVIKQCLDALYSRGMDTAIWDNLDKIAHGWTTGLRVAWKDYRKKYFPDLPDQADRAQAQPRVEIIPTGTEKQIEQQVVAAAPAQTAWNTPQVDPTGRLLGFVIVGVLIALITLVLGEPFRIIFIYSILGALIARELVNTVVWMFIKGYIRLPRRKSKASKAPVDRPIPVNAATNRTTKTLNPKLIERTINVKIPYVAFRIKSLRETIVYLQSQGEKYRKTVQPESFEKTKKHIQFFQAELTALEGSYPYLGDIATLSSAVHNDLQNDLLILAGIRQYDKKIKKEEKLSTYARLEAEREFKQFTVDPLYTQVQRSLKDSEIRQIFLIFNRRHAFAWYLYEQKQQTLEKWLATQR